MLQLLVVRETCPNGSLNASFVIKLLGEKNLTRHIKRVHGDDRVKTATQDQVQSTPKSVEEDEDWDKDPGELIFDEVEIGRTYRKRTTPRLPGVKRKAIEEEPVLSEGQGKEPEVEIEICETTSQEEPLTESHCSCCKAVGREKVDVGTQTNLKVDDQKKRGHQKIIRVIRKYQENGENIEKFEEDTWFD
uniref:Uncharacterized protein n=1 Tax=Magallana gigas TaxID=29159 RepID=A0A8W8NVQ1_MAGGI